MARIGTDKKPAVVRVRSEERAREVLAMAAEAGVKIIVGIEPDKFEDISDLGKAIEKRSAVAAPPRARPAKNAPCPCGSGRKYKGCCGKGKG